MYRFILFSISLYLIFSSQIYAQGNHNPSFEEVISLKSPRNPEISPNGKHVLFEVSSTDWENNRFDREIWISKNGATPFQLTNNIDGSSSNPKWSPNGNWIAFLSKRKDKTQIQVIRTGGGEAFQVTQTEGNIQDFEWSPNSNEIAFRQAEDKSKIDKKRKELYGGYAIEDEEYNQSQLWLIDFIPENLNRNWLPADTKDSLLTESLKPRLLLDSVDFTVTSFQWSPDGKKIAFGHQPNPLINSFLVSDISLLDVETKTHKVLVENKSSDFLAAWSPDGKSILYRTNLDNNTSNFYTNDHLFRINIDGNNNRQLAKDFDEEFSQVKWNDAGIFATVWQKTLRKLMRIDPVNGNWKLLESPVERVVDYSFSKDATEIVFAGGGKDVLTELYRANYPLKSPKKFTDFTNQIDEWAFAQSEVISWSSKDGATIEGVLHKPQDFDPNKKYPLMVVIHGGPTGISTPGPTPAYVYPMIQWLNKGALVLRPNYRGSAGYGEAFRSLNVKNLGVGDAWDVESGVDYLIKEGMVDPAKVASMGWSQGGYISAFLTTNSDKFQAISVGAGISNWMTYYVNTDIHPFTRQYLKATPWSDKAIYEKTSPMTNINNAKTPTLIQHGEFDRRVPTANAYELFQGLQDVGVETELIIYKGFGHGISKPKERLAAVWHNWQWFGKYIWDEEIEVPMGEE